MSNPSILIVEDEAIVAEDLASKVRQLGYDVAGITATGEEAIELARQQRPSLVLMDIRLSDAMDGIEAAQGINRTYDIPVLFLTAHSDTTTVERARQAGAFGYILKPFDERDLRIQVEMALYKHTMDQRLRESEERYRFALETAHIGAWDLDLVGHGAFRSIEHDRIFGYPELLQEWTYEMFLEHVLPEDRAMVDGKFQVAVEGQGAWNFECRILRADGELRWIWAAGRHHHFSAGTSRRMAGIVQDITEGKHAKAALEKLNEELGIRVSERTQELEGVIEILQHEIAEREKAEESEHRLNRLYAVLSETNQTIVRANNKDTLFKDLCQIAVKNGSFKLAWVGLVDEESGVLKVVNSAGSTGYLEDIRITVNEEPTGLGPTGIAVRDGSYFICNDFLGSPITLPWHKRGRAHGIRASASIALKQEGRVIGALTLYADQKDFFDQQQVELLRQMGADVSYALDNFILEARRQEAEQALRLETLERLRAEEEIRAINAELEQRVADRTAELQLEIAERKRAEKQIQFMNDELELRVEQRTRELQETQKQFLHAEKLSAIGRLSASIAHEFNNPLQGIQSVLKGLKKRAVLEAEDRQLLEEAIEESNRIRDLIRDLQDFNRPSSSTKRFLDIHKTLDAILLLHKNDFKEKRISLVRDYAEQLPQIEAVSDQIKQVFLNMLTNAADACLQPGGVITVSTRLENQEKVAVAIKDNGIGIKPSDRDLIFQPFFTTKSEVKGTGLGLSVSHGIIANHQGEIHVESELGKGTTFTILLPIKGAAVTS